MTPATLNLTIDIGLTFGPLTIIARDAVATPIDLTNWKVWAYSRSTTEGAVEIDLAPTITDAVNGTVTMTKTDEQTTLLPVGTYSWDLIFENATGARHGPYLSGTLTVRKPITRPAYA